MHAARAWDEKHKIVPLALVLSHLNTAKYSLCENEQFEDSRRRAWTVLCLLRNGALGGDLNVRQTLSGFKTFIT